MKTKLLFFITLLLLYFNPIYGQNKTFDEILNNRIDKCATYLGQFKKDSAKIEIKKMQLLMDENNPKLSLFVKLESNFDNDKEAIVILKQLFDEGYKDFSKIIAYKYMALSDHGNSVAWFEKYGDNRLLFWDKHFYSVECLNAGKTDKLNEIIKFYTSDKLGAMLVKTNITAIPILQPIVTNYFDYLDIQNQKIIFDLMEQLEIDIFSLRSKMTVADIWFNGNANFPKNENKAFELYKKIADNQNLSQEISKYNLDHLTKAYAASLRSVGYLYFKGIGTKKDKEKAKYYIEKAANYGDPTAVSWMQSIK